MESYFGEVVQNFELKRVRGAPKGHLFAPYTKPLFVCGRKKAAVLDALVATICGEETLSYMEFSL